MANIAKKYYNEEISRLNSINNRYEELSGVARNLNLLALQDKLAPVFHREAEIEAIQKLMLRRTKPNALLTGPAGCGKTAIAEALAIHIAHMRVAWCNEDAKAQREYDKAYSKWLDTEGGEEPVRKEVPKPPLCDAVIFDLSMNAMVSGSRYRGDFEEKLQKIMNICKREPNIILFIDEIHQMCEMGKADGASGMGQILKPALARRFSDVEIRPLCGEKALSTAGCILADYEKFHGVSVREVSAENILEMVNFHIGGVFPNNFIDVIDEAMSGARYEGHTSIGLREIKATLSRMTGNIIL